MTTDFDVEAPLHEDAAAIGVRAVVDDREETVLRGALEAGGWNISEAARLLGMPVNTVWSAVKRHPVLDRDRVANRTSYARGGQRTRVPEVTKLRLLLRKHGWDLTLVGEELGIVARTVRRWLRVRGLEADWRRIWVERTKTAA